MSAVIAAVSAETLFANTAPMHALPWYFGVSVFVVWSAAAAGLLLLVRRRLKARAERRALAHARVRAPAPIVSDDRSLGSGTDVERW